MVILQVLVVLVVLGVVLVVLEVVLQLLLLQLRVLVRKVEEGLGRFRKVWNFGRLVTGTLGSHRYQTKTHGSHHLGAQFGHKISSN